LAALDVLVPFGVITVILTVPTAPAGLTAVIDVALFTVKLAAAVLPKLTAVAPVKLVPVIVTDVPPEVGPLPGLIAVTAGAGTYV
jgi:preprotein translocase subunit SecG